MTSSTLGWYGPLIDLSETPSHINQYVQLVVFIHRATPLQYKVSNGGGEIIRTDIQVGDDTRPVFSVSLWHKHLASLAVAGHIILLQNVKITKYRDVIEAKTVQCSSLRSLIHPYDSLISKGIDELVRDCSVGVTIKEKLIKVINWVQKSGYALPSIRLHSSQNGQLLKNWKSLDDEKSWNCTSLAEVSQLKNSCRAIFYASVGEIFMPFSWKAVGKVEKEKMFISRRLSETEDDGLVEDLICTGCKLCGSPLDVDDRSIFSKASIPSCCPRSSNRLHVVGHIYRPFMLYVWDDLEYIPIYVRNKAAEVLFGSIKAEGVYSWYRSQKNHQKHSLRDVEMQNCFGVGTNDNPKANKDLGAASCSGINKSQRQERKDHNKTINHYLIWLILLKMLLRQGINSPLKFEIIVNPSMDMENERFELLSVSMPCYSDN